MPVPTKQIARRRAIHFVPSAPFGGIQTLVPLIAQTQANGGRNVELAVFGRAERLLQFLDAEKIDVPVRRHRGPTAPLSLLWQLTVSRDAIWHSHCEPIWATLLMAVTMPRRWVVHLHEYPDRPDNWRTRLSQALHKRMVCRWIAISRSVAAAWSGAEKAPESRIDVAWNAIRLPDAPCQRGKKSNFTVGFVGRVVEMKGIFDFVRLAATMREEKDFEFHVYGEGSDLQAAQVLASDLGIADKIIFHGFAAEMPTVWSSLDASAMFSTREPFGLVILEAIAHGVGVVVFDSESGASEVARNLRATQLVPAGDLVASANALREWRNNRQLLEEALLRDREALRREFDLRRLASDIDGSYARVD